MDVVENGTISLRRASGQWNTPLTSLSNHLYGTTRTRKPRPISILTLKEIKLWLFGFYLCRMLGYQLACNNQK
jgi:hypothetical protein